jgi:hypothetical protein
MIVCRLSVLAILLARWFSVYSSNRSNPIPEFHFEDLFVKPHAWYQLPSWLMLQQISTGLIQLSQEMLINGSWLERTYIFFF